MFPAFHHNATVHDKATGPLPDDPRAYAPCIQPFQAEVGVRCSRPVAHDQEYELTWDNIVSHYIVNPCGEVCSPWRTSDGPEQPIWAPINGVTLHNARCPWAIREFPLSEKRGPRLMLNSRHLGGQLPPRNTWHFPMTVDVAWAIHRRSPPSHPPPARPPQQLRLWPLTRSI